MQNNIEKGKLGEQIVADILNNFVDAENYIINNLIYRFPSVLYKDGFLSTQIDHLFITPNYIYCIETKFYEHLVTHRYAEEYWDTSYGEPVENPIFQNHKHKEIISHIFSLPLEDIMTIEVIIGSDITGYHSSQIFPNDYICDIDNLETLLTLLLNTTHIPSYVISTLYPKLLKSNLLYNKNPAQISYEEKMHTERLAFAQKINTFLKRRHHRTYRYLDTARCHFCNKYLAFRKFQSIKKGNIRNSKDYLIGCTGYNSDPTKCTCTRKPIYNYDSLEITRINFPNEEQNMTMIELIEENNQLKESLTEKTNELESLRKNFIIYNCKINNLEKELNKQKAKCDNLTQQIEKLPGYIRKFYKI